jgi:hypothetical protein
MFQISQGCPSNITAFLALPRKRTPIYYAIPETYKIVENTLKIMQGTSNAFALEISLNGNGPFWGSSALILGVS